MAGVSLRPGDAVEGGGAPFDRELIITAAKVQSNTELIPNRGEERFNNCEVVFTLQDPEDGTEWQQNLSCGSLERFVPSEDGTEIVPVTVGNQLNTNARFVKWITEAVRSGYDESLITTKVSDFIGFHYYAVAMKFEGSTRDTSVPGRTILMPGESVGASPKASANGVVHEAVEFLRSYVEAKELQTLTRQELGSAVFNPDFGLKDNDRRNAISSVLFGHEFAEALLEGGFSLDGDTITVG